MKHELFFLNLKLINTIKIKYFVDFTNLDGAEQKRSDADGREESTHEDGDCFTGFNNSITLPYL